MPDKSVITLFNVSVRPYSARAVKTESFMGIEELTKYFNKCEKGTKAEGLAFIRCEIYDRKIVDRTLNSRILVIDGDYGAKPGYNAPDPVKVHEGLKRLGYKHIIYTSHSHSSSKNKFRVLIETDVPYYNKDLEINIDKILGELSAEGCIIGKNKEMKSFKQLWYFPRRTNPADEKFEYYEYLDSEANLFEIIEGDEIDEQETKTKKKKDQAEGDKEGDSERSLESMYEEIRTGARLHDNLRDISYQLVKDGMSSAHIKSFLKMIMSGSVIAGEERWQERYDDIDRIVEGAVDISDQQMEEADFELKPINTELITNKDIPLPPGLFGQLYKDCYNYLLYQYPEVALSASLGVVAGIIGRRYNVIDPARTGLNLYITLIASTGCGKDRINDFINLCMRDELNDYSSFIGPSKFYSPKAIVNSFSSARSRVCVFSEAGLLMKVKAGSVEAMTAFILDSFQSSGRDSYTKEASYSSKEDSMPRLRSMAMSVVSESSPEEMITAFRESNALKGGMLPRQLIFRVSKRQVKPNRKIISDVSGPVRERLRELLRECSKYQAENKIDTIDLCFKDEMYEDLFKYIEECNILSSEAEGENELIQHMATRSAQKAIRLAGITSVFNGLDTIGKEEWEWAKGLVKYELDHMNQTLNGVIGDDDGFEENSLYLYRRILDILDKRVKDKVVIDGMCKQYYKHKMIPWSILLRSIRNNKSIMKRQVNGTTKFDTILKEWERHNCISIKEKVAMNVNSNKKTKFLFVRKELSDFIDTLYGKDS